MTTTLAKMDRAALRAAARTLGLEKVADYGVPALRTWISQKTGTEIDAPFTPPVRTLNRTTEPTARALAARQVAIPFGSRISKTYNNDGSITCYAQGLKVFRTLATEGDDVEIDEDYDPEEEVAKFCNKWFGSAEHKYGKVAHGHFWKRTKKATAEEASAEEKN